MTNSRRAPAPHGVLGSPPEISRQEGKPTWKIKETQTASNPQTHTCSGPCSATETIDRPKSRPRSGPQPKFPTTKSQFQDFDRGVMPIAGMPVHVFEEAVAWLCNRGLLGVLQRGDRASGGAAAARSRQGGGGHPMPRGSPPMANLKTTGNPYYCDNRELAKSGQLPWGIDSIASKGKYQGFLLFF